MNAPSEDMVYTDCDILVDADGTRASAIFVRGGKVGAVGSKEEVLQAAGPSVPQTSLRGATIVPGLFDTHPHLLHFSAFSAGLVNLERVRDHAEIVTAIHNKASEIPEGDWVVATPIGEPSYYLRRSWRNLREGTFPDRYVLDKASNRHPIMITAWAPTLPNIVGFNSAALKLLCLDESGPDDTSNVKIEKDEQGRPTGVLTGSVTAYYNNDPYWETLAPKLPPLINPEHVPAAVINSMQEANARGITAIWEAHAMEPEHIELYKTLHDRSLLTLRVQAAPELEASKFYGRPDLPMEAFQAKLDQVATSTTTVGEWLRIDGVTTASYGAFSCGDMFWPLGYKDAWGNTSYGTRQLASEKIDLAIQYCANNHLRLHYGCGSCYDVDDFLTKAEQAMRRSGRKTLDWIVQHGYLLREGQPGTMARLGIDQTVSVGFTFGKGDNFEKRVGPDVLPLLNPLRDLLDSKVRVAASSDWGPASPWEQMQLAVTHKMYPSGKANDGPRQVVSRAEAFWMWTAGARILGWDGLGSLKVGSFADLVIVDRNPVTCALEELPHTKVHRSVVNGGVVYDDNTFSS